MTQAKKTSKGPRLSRAATQAPTVSVEPEVILAALLVLIGVVMPVYSMLSGHFAGFHAGLLMAPSTTLGLVCVWRVVKSGATIPVYVRAVVWILAFAMAFFSTLWFSGSLLAAAFMYIPVFPFVILLIALSGIVAMLMAPKKR
jgi:hypothetical protein